MNLTVPVFPFKIMECEIAPSAWYLTPGRKEPPEMPVAAKNASLLLIKVSTVRILLRFVP